MLFARGRCCGIDDLDPVEVGAQFGGTGANGGLVTQQDGGGETLVMDLVGGADDLLVGALGEDDAARIGAGLSEDDAHQLARAPEAAFQLRDIGLALQRHAGHARLNGGLGDGGRHREKHARVEGFGDEVVRAEAQRAQAVGLGHGVGDILAGEVGQGARGGDLHLLGDLAGPHVERPRGR